tara:strand:+ start:134 stop:436 length:303 start_codon:yes stop_codon:yes gene_type:complete
MTTSDENENSGAERVNPVRAAILKLVSESEVGETFDPSRVAQLVSKDKWQNLTGDIRAEAVRMAVAGEISIYRKGREVDPKDFKGVWRLGRPGKVIEKKD